MRLGEHHAGVVAGLHDDAADQRLDRHRGADLDEHLAAAHAPGALAHRQLLRRASAGPASACRRPCTWSSASTWRTAASAHRRSSPAAPHRCRSRPRKPAWRRCRAGRAAWTLASRAARPVWTRRRRCRCRALPRCRAPWAKAGNGGRSAEATAAAAGKSSERRRRGMSARSGIPEKVPGRIHLIGYSFLMLRLKRLPHALQSRTILASMIPRRSAAPSAASASATVAKGPSRTPYCAARPEPIACDPAAAADRRGPPLGEVAPEEGSGIQHQPRRHDAALRHLLRQAHGTPRRGRSLRDDRLPDGPRRSVRRPPPRWPARRAAARAAPAPPQAAARWRWRGAAPPHRAAPRRQRGSTPGRSTRVPWPVRPAACPAVRQRAATGR